MGRLDVRVCGVRNLPSTQVFGEIDPYCVVRLEHQQQRTSTCEDSKNPTWNECFKFTVADEMSSQVRFELWNKNVISDDFLGCYTLSISGLKQGKVREGWYLLHNCKSNAELHVKIRALDFGELLLPAAGGNNLPPYYDGTTNSGGASTTAATMMGGVPTYMPPQMIGRVPNDYRPNPPPQPTAPAVQQQQPPPVAVDGHTTTYTTTSTGEHYVDQDDDGTWFEELDLPLDSVLDPMKEGASVGVDAAEGLFDSVRFKAEDGWDFFVDKIL